MSLPAASPIAPPGPALVREARAAANAACGVWQLPFRAWVWRGQSGNWQGASSGSSLDFQDHRPYFAGDDPRHINWQAYARTGNVTLKVYREEVSPSADLLLDTSASMWAHPAKARRALETFLFCAASARRGGCSVRLWLAAGGRAVPREPMQLEGDNWLEGAPTGGTGETAAATGWRSLPWRSQALRLIVSDLLFSGAPTEHLPPGRHRTLVFAPFDRLEARPDWEDDVELIDSETGQRRSHEFDQAAHGRYQAAYARHFGSWEAALRRTEGRLARLSSAGALTDALNEISRTTGAVEPVK